MSELIVKYNNATFTVNNNNTGFKYTCTNIHQNIMNSIILESSCFDIMLLYNSICSLIDIITCNSYIMIIIGNCKQYIVNNDPSTIKNSLTNILNGKSNDIIYSISNMLHKVHENIRYYNITKLNVFLIGNGVSKQYDNYCSHILWSNNIDPICQFVNNLFFYVYNFNSSTVYGNIETLVKYLHSKNINYNHIKKNIQSLYSYITSTKISNVPVINVHGIEFKIGDIIYTTDKLFNNTEILSIVDTDFISKMIIDNEINLGLDYVYYSNTNDNNITTYLQSLKKYKNKSKEFELMLKMNETIKDVYIKLANYNDLLMKFSEIKNKYYDVEYLVYNLNKTSIN